MSEAAIPENLEDEVSKWHDEGQTQRDISRLLKEKHDLSASRTAVASCLKRIQKEDQDVQRILFSEPDIEVEPGPAGSRVERLEKIDRDLELAARRAVARDDQRTLILARLGQARIATTLLEQERHEERLALRERLAGGRYLPVPGFHHTPDAAPGSETDDEETEAEKAWGRAQEIRAHLPPANNEDFGWNDPPRGSLVDAQAETGT